MSTHNYTKRMKRIAQVGMMAKGVVYFIFGSLIFSTTFSVISEPVGLFEVLKFIIYQGTFGRMAVLLMALGLLCYSAWKYYQMAHNAEGYENDALGIFIRISWVGPFVFYLFLGGHALIQLFNWYFRDFNLDVGNGTLLDFTSSATGFWVVTLVAIVLLLNAGTLFFLAISGKYKLLLSGKDFFETNPKLATTTGFVGYTGYGVTLLLLGGLFTTSLIIKDSSFAQGQDSLFIFLISQPFGKIALSIIALGTICYGLYFFLAAFYRWRKPTNKAS
jgi:hypothetical protein